MPTMQPAILLMAMLTVPVLGVASVSAVHHWMASTAEAKQRQSPLQVLPAVERKITDY